MTRGNIFANRILNTTGLDVRSISGPSGNLAQTGNSNRRGPAVSVVFESLNLVFSLNGQR